MSLPVWGYLQSLGATVSVSTTPTQVLAPLTFPTASSKTVVAEFYNDDATNTVTFTLYRSGDTTRPNVTPQSVVVPPQSMDRVQIPDMGDGSIWASATSGAGVCITKTAVSMRPNAA